MKLDGRDGTRSGGDAAGELEQVRRELDQLVEARLLGRLTEDAAFRYEVLLDREMWLLTQRKAS